MAYSAATDIDSQPFAAVEREARVDLLGVGDLRNKKENPRHRPPGIDSPLLRDTIVQTVLFERAANPKKQTKAIVIDVGAYYGVSRGYIYRCLKDIAPERRNQMVEFNSKDKIFRRSAHAGANSRRTDLTLLTHIDFSRTRFPYPRKKSAHMSTSG